MNEMQIQTRINLHHAICLISATKHFWKNFPENVWGFLVFLQFCVESQYNFVFISKATASFFLNIYASASECSFSLNVLVLVFTRDVSLLTRCQLTLRKKDKLMANVSFDQDMEFYISVYLLKSQLKLHLFVESRFLCSI